MLAADEHPGAFLEDELPFAPRPVQPDPGPSPPGEQPWPWFQRWRVPITALFVVLIALAVALAFGSKPDDPAARVPLGSAPASTVTSVGPADPAGPVDTATAADRSTVEPAATVVSPPSISDAGPTTAPTTTATTGRPGPRPPAAPPPASASTASTVPGYATGSTQARGPNEPPFIANPGQVQSTVGQPVRYQIGVSARPDERLTFSATGLPRGLTIDPATGLVTGTPERAETTGVQVTVAGGQGSSFTQGFTWAVTG